jgi:16S rRNA processing protein RimM
VGSRLDTDRPELGSLTVAATRWHSGELLVRFEGYRDRTSAEELRGTWLSIDTDTLAPTGDPDVFHDHELIGLTVQTVDGTEVGIVEDVLHPAQDVLSVRGASGDVLVPFVKAIVTEVDVAGGVLVIDPPPGLLDLETL